jgi:hypothetical protein
MYMPIFSCVYIQKDPVNNFKKVLVSCPFKILYVGVPDEQLC